MSKLRFSYYFLAVSLLAIITFYTALWQSSRILDLIDWSYFTESAYRIFCGQKIYVDFGIPMTPGSFYTQALLMKIFGPFAMVQRYYTAAAASLVIIFSYFTLRRIGKKSFLDVVFCIPLIFGVYVISPFVSYDCDAVLICLAVILYFLYIPTDDASSLIYQFILGFATVVPLFFKQSLGGGFLIGMFLGQTILAFQKKNYFSLKHYTVFIIGIICAFSLWAGALYQQGGVSAWKNFYFWVFKSALSGRGGTHQIFSNLIAGYLDLTSLLLIYASISSCILAISYIFLKKHRKTRLLLLFALVLPWIVFPVLYLINSVDYTALWHDIIFLPFAAILILSIPCIIHSIFYAEEKTTPVVILITLICAMNADFVSQTIAGSSYALMPFLIISSKIVFSYARSLFKIETLKYLAAFCLSYTVSAGAYVLTNDRLLYVNNDGPLQTSNTPGLYGLRTRGDWLPQFDALVTWTQNNIPLNDSIALIPGEDPFFFATRRPPSHIPMFQMNPVAWPYPMTWIIDAANQQKTQWIIVKYRVQMPAGFFMNYEQELTPLILKSHYILVKTLPNYKIYKREG